MAVVKKIDGFSKLSIKKLILRSGAERISEDGIQMMKNYLERLADEISSTAVKINHKNGEKRITKKEIDLAFDIYKGKL